MSANESPRDLTQDVSFLKWPEDKASLACLNSSELILWYASQEPRQAVWMGQDPEFKKFWYRKYLLPLRLKRLLYKYTKWVR